MGGGGRGKGGGRGRGAGGGGDYLGMMNPSWSRIESSLELEKSRGAPKDVLCTLIPSSSNISSGHQIATASRNATTTARKNSIDIDVSIHHMVSVFNNNIFMWSARGGRG